MTFYFFFFFFSFSFFFANLAASSRTWSIEYTVCDEAPQLATYALLPVLRRFAQPYDIAVNSPDISLAARVVAQWSDVLPPHLRLPDALARLGLLTQKVHAHQIYTVLLCVFCFLVLFFNSLSLSHAKGPYTPNLHLFLCVFCCFCFLVLFFNSCEIYTFFCVFFVFVFWFCFSTLLLTQKVHAKFTPFFVLFVFGFVFQLFVPFRWRPTLSSCQTSVPRFRSSTRPLQSCRARDTTFPISLKTQRRLLRFFFFFFFPFFCKFNSKIDAAARYAKVLGSAVNPVLREGNSDRRVAAPVKRNAQRSKPPVN